MEIEGMEKSIPDTAVEREVSFCITFLEERMGEGDFLCFDLFPGDLVDENGMPVDLEIYGLEQDPFSFSELYILPPDRAYAIFCWPETREGAAEFNRRLEEYLTRAGWEKDKCYGDIDEDFLLS